MNIQKHRTSQRMSLFGPALLVLLFLGGGALEYGSAQESRAGNFKVLIEKKAGARNATETNHWFVRVVDRTGKDLYRIAKELPFDVQFPAIHVSDIQGRAVVVQPLNGTVEFYDGRGGLANTMDFSLTNNLDYERILKCSVAGNWVAVLTSERNEEARVIMCTIDGRALWQKELVGKQAAEIMLSASGEVLVAGSYTFTDRLEAYTEMYDGEGLKIREMPGMFRYADISQDNRRVALAGKNAVTIEGTEEGTESLQYHTTSASHIITGVRFVREYLAVVVEYVEFEDGRPFYRPSLVILDNKARHISTREVNVVAEVRALLAIDGDTIVLRSGNQSATLDVRTITR